MIADGYMGSHPLPESQSNCEPVGQHVENAGQQLAFELSEQHCSVTAQHPLVPSGPPRNEPQQTSPLGQHESIELLGQHVSPIGQHEPIELLGQHVSPIGQHPLRPVGPP